MSHTRSSARIVWRPPPFWPTPSARFRGARFILSSSIPASEANAGRSPSRRWRRGTRKARGWWCRIMAC